MRGSSNQRQTKLGFLKIHQWKQRFRCVFVLFSLYAAMNVSYAEDAANYSQLQLSDYFGDDSSDGNMFEVVALSNLIIRAFDVHCSSEEEEIIEVYNRPSELGALRSPGAWTKLSYSDVTVIGAGLEMPTRVSSSLIKPTFIQAGSSSSFYITFQQSWMMNSVVIGNVIVTGSVMFQNSHLQYKMGVGKTYYFANTEYNRAFDGAIYYSLGTFEPTPSPSTSPSSPTIITTDLNPTAFPSDLPSENTPSSYPTIPAYPTISPSLIPTSSVSPTTIYENLPASGYVGEMSNFGVMFELSALQHIIIRTFDIHCSSTASQNIEVYNKSGALGALRSPGAWTLVSVENASVEGQGEGEPTRIPSPLIEAVHIAPSTSTSFYITFTENVMLNSAVIGNVIVTGSVMFQNSHLQYKMGVGKTYYFANTEYNRAFDGAIYYSLGTFEPTPSPSTIPTAFPSGRPSENSTAFPSESPSTSPVQNPTAFPSGRPSENTPSSYPTIFAQPTVEPTISNFDTPVVIASPLPSTIPSFFPTQFPVTINPSRSPSQIMTSLRPSGEPSALATSLPSISPTRLETLTTVFDGTSSNDGNMFDLIAISSVIIREFDIHTSDEGNNLVEIYTRSASFANVAFHPNAWKIVSKTNLSLQGIGNGFPTHLPNDALLEPISITAGSTQAFYITLLNGRYLQQSFADGAGNTGDVYAATSDLAITVGVGKNYFFLHSQENVVWNGRVYYTRSPSDIDAVSFKEGETTSGSRNTFETCYFYKMTSLLCMFASTFLFL